MAEDDSKGEKELGPALATAASAILDQWTQTRPPKRLISTAVLKDGRSVFYVRKDSSAPETRTFKARSEHEMKQYADADTYWSLTMQDMCSMNKAIALALRSWPGGLVLDGRLVEKIDCLDLVPSKAATEFVRKRCSVVNSVSEAPEPTDEHSIILFRVAVGGDDLIFDVSCAQYGEFSHDVVGIACPTVLRPLKKAEYMKDFTSGKDAFHSLNDIAYELDEMAKVDRIAKEYLAYSKAGIAAINEK